MVSHFPDELFHNYADHLTRDNISWKTGPHTVSFITKVKDTGKIVLSNAELELRDSMSKL